MTFDNLRLILYYIKVKTLFIFPRRGLFQITMCKNCGHLFGSPESDSFLVTYRSGNGKLELVDTHSQTVYEYPKECPECHSSDILSKSGGVEDLAEKLESELGTTVKKWYKHVSGDPVQATTLRLFAPYSHSIELSTRLFDPGIDYSLFDTIVILRAENLTASVDYLVHEEVYKSLCELLINIQSHTQIIVDTASLEAPIITDLLKISLSETTPAALYESFVKRELAEREKFKFPPFTNLLLFTTQEKSKVSSKKLIDSVYLLLKKELQQAEYSRDLENDVVSLSPPYPARMLKRKNMFSHHVLLKFPRNYQRFSLLKTTVHSITDSLRLQTRLNPRHIF